MRAEVRDKLSLQTDDFFIDTEIVARARKWNFRIGEKGVRHYPRVAGETTVAAGDVTRTLQTVARMWRRIYIPNESQRNESAQISARVVAREVLPTDTGSVLAWSRASMRSTSGSRVGIGGSSAGGGSSSRSSRRKP